MDAIILDLGADIKGECMLEGYPDKIEVMSYSHNVAMQVTNDVSNSERTSGKPHVGEMSLTKFLDQSTPTLNEYCCAGKRVERGRMNGQLSNAGKTPSPQIPRLEIHSAMLHSDP